MLTKVTMTGADDSIDPQALRRIQLKYPFVEWGILIAKKAYGNPRFPSQYWLEAMYEVPGLNLSCHLCGDYVKKFLKGDYAAVIDLQCREDIWSRFKRVQLNFHGFKHDFNPKQLIHGLTMFDDKEFIFQYDNKNQHILDEIRGRVTNFSALYDLSHGNGISPDFWPKPLNGIKLGYAGGLCVGNVVGEIEKIQKDNENIDYWIDAETWLRSDNDQQFDLTIVEEFLSLCELYIQTTLY